MTEAQQIVQGVEFEPSYKYVPENLVVHRLGFLVLNGAVTSHEDPYINFVGFGMPKWQYGSDELCDIVTPITEFADLDTDMQQSERVLKGVGPRFYNTPQALAGTAESPKAIGAFMIRVDRNMDKTDGKPTAWHDHRRLYSPTNPFGQLGRVLLYTQQKLRADLFGPEGVVNGIHWTQGAAQLAIHHQTPDALRKERQWQQPPSAVREAFLVVRDPRVNILKIGEYHRSETTSIDLAA